MFIQKEQSYQRTVVRCSRKWQSNDGKDKTSGGNNRMGSGEYLTTGSAETHQQITQHHKTSKQTVIQTPLNMRKGRNKLFKITKLSKEQ